MALGAQRHHVRICNRTAIRQPQRVVVIRMMARQAAKRPVIEGQSLVKKFQVTRIIHRRIRLSRVVTCRAGCCHQFASSVDDPKIDRGGPAGRLITTGLNERGSGRALIDTCEESGSAVKAKATRAQLPAHINADTKMMKVRRALRSIVGVLFVNFGPAYGNCQKIKITLSLYLDIQPRTCSITDVTWSTSPFSESEHLHVTTSGLVITLGPDRDAFTMVKQSLGSKFDIEFGEPSGRRLPAVLESKDESVARRSTEFIRANSNVLDVAVVFIDGFGIGSQENHESCNSQSLHTGS